MGNHGDRHRSVNNSSSQNDEFEQLEQKTLKSFVQKIMETIDEMLIRGKAPSPKVLNFLCSLAEGQFITNEKLQEVESRTKKIYELQKQVEILEKENHAIKEMNDKLKTKLEDMEAQKEKITRHYSEIEKRFEERSRKLDSSSINGIVTFD